MLICIFDYNFAHTYVSLIRSSDPLCLKAGDIENIYSTWQTSYWQKTIQQGQFNIIKANVGSDALWERQKDIN